jgi:hypothetical protein
VCGEGAITLTFDNIYTQKGISLKRQLCHWEPSLMMMEKNSRDFLKTQPLLRSPATLPRLARSAAVINLART